MTGTVAMLNSLLLYLEDDRRAEAVIRLGVELAKRANARVRGVTLVDTRATEQACLNESAALVNLLNAGQVLVEHGQSRLHKALSAACLKAKLNFDIRNFVGDPMQVLRRESRFNDLLITAGCASADSTGLKSYDLSELLAGGSHPILMLHPHQGVIQRVLLAYDGSDASGRATRAYFNLGINSHAEHRLLAIGDTVLTAKAALRDMAEYCFHQQGDLETGYVVGKPRKVLASYAEKWQADLVVIGVSKTNWLARRLGGDTPFSMLRQLSCAVFALA
jgi:nucleotide-binding universal stress UspA family protein